MYTANAILLLKVVIPTCSKNKYFINDMPFLYLRQEVIFTILTVFAMRSYK